MIKAIAITEDDVAHFEFRDKRHLEDFREGFGFGVGQYGAGRAMVLTKDDLGQYDADIDKLINEHLK